MSHPCIRGYRRVHLWRVKRRKGNRVRFQCATCALWAEWEKLT